MKKIFKYRLAIEDEQWIDMPAEAQMLSVGVQDGKITVWALIDENANIEPTRFYVVGTGHPAEHLDEHLFIGTVHMPPFVWHVFVSEVSL